MNLFEADQDAPFSRNSLLRFDWEINIMCSSDWR